MTKLTDLLADETVDTDALAGGLRDILAIASDGSIRPLDGWDRLTEKAKVLATLLGLKAAMLLEKRASDIASPIELARMSGVANGTVKRVLRELLSTRLVSVGMKAGSYAVSGAQIRRAIAAIRPEKSGE